MMIGIAFHRGTVSLEPDIPTAILGLVLFPPNAATIPKLPFEPGDTYAYCHAKSLLHKSGLPRYSVSFALNVAASTYGHGNPPPLSTFQSNPIIPCDIQPAVILSSAFAQ